MIDPQPLHFPPCSHDCKASDSPSFETLKHATVDWDDIFFGCFRLAIPPNQGAFQDLKRRFSFLVLFFLVCSSGLALHKCMHMPTP